MITEIKADLVKIINCDDYFIYDVNFVTQNDINYLKVEIDSNTQELDLDVIVRITNLINKYLDENDPIEQEYMLEVTSMGAETLINSAIEVEQAIGGYVFVKTYVKIDNKKEFIGDLIDFKDNVLYLEVDNKGKKNNIAIDYSKVALIRYSVKF